MDKNVVLLEKFNKYHAPAGSKVGGQFISGHKALAAGLNVETPSGMPYIKPAWSLFGNLIAKLYSGAEYATSGEAYSTPIRMSKLTEDYMNASYVTKTEVLQQMGDVLSTVRTDHTRFITNIEIYSGPDSNSAGYYSFGNKSIRVDPVNTTLNGFNGNATVDLGHAFKHQIGYNAWLYLTPEERERFGELIHYPDPEELKDVSWYGNIIYTPKQAEIMNKIKGTTVTSINNYGVTNVFESWAEYFTAVNWNTGSIEGSDTLPSGVLNVAQEISKW